MVEAAPDSSESRRSSFAQTSEGRAPSLSLPVYMNRLDLRERIPARVPRDGYFRSLCPYRPRTPSANIPILIGLEAEVPEFRYAETRRVNPAE
jgi:hypothetical protein